ncbi:single-stranded DNA-binding protein [Actinoplanes sp. NPDC051494]|uniref:single-stranded DNA-binding protein n=1 Tax=Actinoplanes sp. NPDC051494 TaxID=3363907 RepID=UPI0037A9CFAF
MFDTNIVVIGNVLTAPEWRRTANSNTLVANFRVASNARRLDRETGRWVDGNHLRVRVSCWRRLAEGVASSVTVGDPVVVSGRLYTRDWTDSEGNLRTSYEMEAAAVGHDLARGRGKFFRAKTAGTAAVETPEALDRVRGESVAVISEDEAPAIYGDGVPEADEPMFEDPAFAPLEAVPALRGGGFEPFDTQLILSSALPAEEPAEQDQPGPDQPELDQAEQDQAEQDQAEQDRPGQEETDGEDESDAVAEPSAALAGTAEPLPAPRRARGRNPRRQPVAA